MKELFDMSQAHLNNVKQEIERLSQQRDQINTEIENLGKYLEEGVKVLEDYKSETSKQDSATQGTLFS